MKLALVGLGSMGQNYLNTVSQLKDISIKYISTRKSDYKELINYKIDGIIIATPSSTHFEIASFFLKHHLPLLIEKPLTTNFTDAKKLLVLQKKTPVLVGHTLLFHKGYLKIKKELGKIGKIQRLEFIGENNKPRTDTALIYDWGSHGVSLFLDLMGKGPLDLKIIKYKNKAGRVVSLQAKLIFPKQIVADLNIAWNSTSKKRSFKVTGEKGTLEFDDILLPDKPLARELKDFCKVIRGEATQTDLAFGVRVIKYLDILNGLLERLELL